MAKQLFNSNSNDAVSLDDLNNTSTEVQPDALSAQPTEVVPPVVEKSQEPVVDTPPETPPLAQPEIKVEPEVKVEPVVAEPDLGNPQPTLDISVLNKDLGRNFESLDSLKAELDKSSKVDEYETRLQGLDTLKASEQEIREKYEILLELAEDPMKNFSNEQSYKLEQFKKANPKKNPAVAQSIFMTEDLNTVDDFDIVKWGYQLDNPSLKGGEEGIKQTVADEFGIDPELGLDEWSLSAQNRLAIKANEYRGKFNTMSDIETPNKLDIDGIRQQRQADANTSLESIKSAWDEASKSLDVSKLQIPTNIPKEGETQAYFEYDLGEQSKETVSRIVEEMVANGSEVNEQTLTFAKEAAQMALFKENMPQAISKLIEANNHVKEEEHLKNTHNPEPLHDETRPEGDVAKEKKDFNEWASKTTGGFQRKPMIRKKD